jgi:hypothetical protein
MSRPSAIVCETVRFIRLVLRLFVHGPYNMTDFFRLGSPVILLTFLVAASAHAQSTHWLAVSHFMDAPGISQDEADHILAGMSELFRMRYPRGGAAALVTFCLDRVSNAESRPGCTGGSKSAESRSLKPRATNPIIQLPGSSTIFSQRDFNRIAKSKGYVKIVREIFWCEGQTLAGPGSFLGCSSDRPQSMAVTRLPAGYPCTDDLTDNDPSVARDFLEPPPCEVVVWAHEYVHTKAIRPHREPPVPGALMNSKVSTRNHIFTEAECRAVLAPHKRNSFARTKSLPCACGAGHS